MQGKSKKIEENRRESTEIDENWWKLIDVTLAGHPLVVWLQLSIFFDNLWEKTKEIEEIEREIGKNRWESTKIDENRWKLIDLTLGSTV